MRKICLTVDLIGDLYAFIRIVSSVQEALWKVRNITFTAYPGIVPRFEWNIRIELNPFTAAACKTFRAERYTDASANSIFPGPITSAFNALRFHDYPFTCQCKKKKKKGLRV